MTTAATERSVIAAQVDLFRVQIVALKLVEMEGR